MKQLRQALQGSVSPGIVATLATCLMVARQGRKDSGSAIAPINASSHVLWGESAAVQEKVTVRHTLPGVLVNLGGAMWWAVVYQKLFGAAMDRRGPSAVLSGACATAALAYIVDYHLVPRRLTPGWEYRLSNRSLFLSLGAMAGGLATGAMLKRKGIPAGFSRQL